MIFPCWPASCTENYTILLLLKCCLTQLLSALFPSARQPKTPREQPALTDPGGLRTQSRPLGARLSLPGDNRTHRPGPSEPPEPPGCNLLQLCSPTKRPCKGIGFFKLIFRVFTQPPLNLPGTHWAVAPGFWSTYSPFRSDRGCSAVTSLPCPSSRSLPVPSQQVQRCCCCAPTEPGNWHCS